MEVEAAEAAPSGFVRLRVGGVLFEASEDTLRSERGSMFDAMLNGPWKNRCDHSGAIVFDRDPKRFRALLNFLRTRELILEDGVTAQGVKQEAEFFQIEDAVTAAEKLNMEFDTASLLKVVVDGREGKLMTATQDSLCAFTEDLSIHIHCPSLITLEANFGAVVGARPVVRLESEEGCTRLVTHVQDNSRTVRAIAKVDPGTHRLQILFHVAAEEDNDSIRSPHKKARGQVHGPARVEIWRYPNDSRVSWTDPFNVCHPERNARRQVDMWLCGSETGDASVLAEAVGAISASVYN